MKIAFDIGGVLSKYPDQFREMLKDFSNSEIFVITDMHDKAEVVKMLTDNGFIKTVVGFGPIGPIYEQNVYCADYKTHGDMCKAVLLKELGIDIFFDDFVGYTNWDSSLGPAPIRLLVMPDPWKPYWADSWKVPVESDFGRRRYYGQTREINPT